MAGLPPFASPLAIDLPPMSEVHENAWIEVIQRMEETYSDLIRYEVDLEEKNTKLEEAQRFITSVLTSMSDILLVSDSRGRVLQANQAFLDLTGLAAAQVVGAPLDGLLAGDAATRVCAQGVSDCEVRFRAGAGVTEPVAINCTPRHDHLGRRAGLVVIGRRVGELQRAYGALNTAHAELKQAQRQLVQAEKMASLGRLVAGVAHELNNPISFITGNVHALDRYRTRLTTYLGAIHDGADDEAREELRRALRIDALLADLGPLIDGTLEGAQRVGDIVKNLRRLSFTPAGEPQSVPLAKVVANAVQWAVRGQVPQVAVEIAIDDAIMVRCHPNQIHQVVVNLVRNALDALAGHPDPRLSIDAVADGAIARVGVADNGPGIAEAHLLKVFDPFFTTKPVGQGTGLGLWIGYGIIKDHGGTIEAANRPECGARFVFTLPADPPAG